MSRPLPLLLLSVLCAACTETPVDPHAGHGDAGPFDSTPIAPAPGEALWVVNGQGPSFTVVALDGVELPDGGVDASRIRVHGTVALSGVRFPHHVSLSPDRSFLVVADPGMDFSRGHNHADGGLGMDMQGALLKLDARSGQALAGTLLARMNHNGAISADGREVWTTAMTNPGQALVLDAHTLLPLAEPITLTDQGAPQDGATEVTFSPDGRRAFVANGLSGTLSVLDVASRQLTSTLRVGRDPVGAWPGADGLMYADNELGQTVSVVDPGGAGEPRVLRSIDLGFTPGMAAATPEGQLWVSDSTNGQVVVYPPGGAVPLAAVPTGAGAHGLAFSPSHRLLFVTNQWEDTLSVVDVQARQVIQRLPTGRAPNGLVYRSP
jgi:YVTN family beta-propeller protein